MDQAKKFLALGLMSGTSADGIDAALIRTDGKFQIQPLGGCTTHYGSAFRQQLLTLATKDLDLANVLRMEDQLTRQHAAAALEACSRLNVDFNKVDVVGFHGHTIRHLPQEHLSWQIGNGSLLAQLVGRPVVSRFRQADLAAGGEGAPLAPLYHQAVVLGDTPQASGQWDVPQLVLNIGGVANLTWFHRDQIIAGDTGPGCGLLDAWVEQRTGETMDKNGQWALAGRVHGDRVLAAMEEIDFFARPLPKSADRFDFDSVDVTSLSTEDGAATLCDLTAQAIRHAVAQLPMPPARVWVAGGGQHHPLIMQRLSAMLPNVAPISGMGHNADWLEAECFAWLAVRRLLGLPTSVPTTTGAAVATCGGELANPLTG